VAESARLLNGYTPKGYRGFESHPLRHFGRETPVKWGFGYCRIRQFLPNQPLSCPIFVQWLQEIEV
jgi:hypothetical protein